MEILIMSNDRETGIRQRAHKIWEELGRPEGQEEDHWRQAEAELGLDEREELPNDLGAAEPGAGEALVAPADPETEPSTGR
jgi:hypothetical protein